MKYLLLFALLILTSIVSPSTWAFQPKNTNECEQKFSTTAELSQCLDIVKDAADKEMQTWINNQVFVLEEFAIVTGRTSALEMFKRSQRNFITFRENNCRWQYLHISPGTGAASAFKKCYILLTKNRIAELSQLN